MLRWLIVLVAALAAALVAALSGVTAGYAAPPHVSDQDKAFLIGAHQDNLAEIQGGQLAERQAGKQSVRDAGKKFVEDHTALDDQLKRVAEKLSVDLPSRPSEEQQAELRRFSAKGGTEFDRAWIDAQVKDHRTTLDFLDKEISTGSSPDVENLAQDAKPVVREHLNLVESIQSGE
ncbi:DUF4142 domain-containing protein [Microbispora bryophytorum]|uniref:DUF4142 domain-containing protein n=1 Tax=Microbispora bryophytorum subsp. camponoti TaxID=1677852 RepID=A0ABR8L2F8_9ACTN|nr:DUF4142 domain-containing protein [Microbispora camponoti]MBD3145145.1 DUF4142 domain-containing protein [Microbispora camponoti]